ncbi:translation elongation factor 4 [Xylocopilactobacillus apicola]|uniref:Elongation factor 4 n=1 Tax=Xylocopilactobacillus apicola TaxID=2932184 RepID=A0AAU9DUK4_9LACO|nr:translation elongation factor 4 [Xylocopilactobacillus apicola]BDR59168.1 elongation factor 4 2 [Xylocopilactobacillus apicola]
MNQKYIRNFSIIAHIDHGKSTLADRIMELTHTIDKRDEKDQLLDDLKVEQEHGVTVKSRTVRNVYQAKDGHQYEYNFIDTPGHVDFSYEVSKSLAASDGAILLVDATQGVQAQTVANYRLAKKNHLAIIPVINKVDMPAANVEETEEQIRELDDDLIEAEILKISAKTGLGVEAVLEAIHTRIPAPKGDPKETLKALVFDSLYNPFLGIIAYVRIFEGTLKTDEQAILVAENVNIQTNEIGIFTPEMKQVDQLSVGDVGYVVTGLKDPQLVRVGDTLTLKDHPTKTPLQGYESAKSVVFAGFYPKNNDYQELKSALAKLVLNDPSLHYREELSDALGPGFRCGFLGMFHLQIIQERLKNEYGLEVLTTAPNVTYRIHLKKDGEVKEITNPTQFPYFNEIDYIEEPIVNATIEVPNDLMSAVMKLADQHKGELMDMDSSAKNAELIYQIPVSEVAYQFFNELKSVSHGYATLDTEDAGYQKADVVKVEVDINYSPIDALSFVVHRSDAARLTQELVHKLKYTVPRALYPMPAQAIVEGKALARVDIPPLRKNAAVSATKKSISKKQDLLRRQSVNKRQAVKNNVKLSQEVFNSILELKQ